MVKGSARWGRPLALSLATCLAAIGLAFPSAAADDLSHQTAHFLIHYTLADGDPDAPDPTDADGSGIPDVVERLGDALEWARSEELSLGFKAPPVEGRYEVFVARSEGLPFVRPGPGGDGKSKPSLMVLPPYQLRAELPDENIRSLAVHEYFHAIQYGYDYHESSWMLEASASWMQEQLLDDLNPQQWTLPDFLLHQRAGIQSTAGQHEYGAFLFLQFVTERYAGPDLGGAPLIRRLWELMADPSVVEGSEDLTAEEAVAYLAIHDLGTSMDDLWREFLVWQRRLNLFQEGESYRAAMTGMGWPVFASNTKIGRSTCRSAPGDESFPILSGDYLTLSPGKRAKGNAELTVRASPASTGYVRVTGGVAGETSLEFDDDGIARARFPFEERSVRKVIVALGNASIVAAVPRMDYSVVVDGRPPVVQVAAPSGARTITYGESLRLSGVVTCNGKPASFAEVSLRFDDAVTGERETRLFETDEDGGWSSLVTPEAIGSWSVATSDPLLPEQASSPSNLIVRSAVYIDVEDQIVRPGGVVGMSGSVVPSAPAAEVLIELRRPEAARWREGPILLTDGGGGFAEELELPGPGYWEVRARIVRSPDLQRAPGTSFDVLVYQEDP